MALVVSLGDCVLFLGGNHSVSLSAEEHREGKRNSIYFTHVNGIGSMKIIGKGS